MTVWAIRCGTLFDGTGAAPVRDAVVIVEDGRITAVGRADATAAPAGAAHARSERSLRHAGPHRLPQPRLDRPRARRSARPALPGAGAAGPGRHANLRQDLAAGTTTMRIMGEEHFVDIEVRDAIEAGVITGPRLLVAGRGLAASNGHGRALVGFDGVDEVRRGARENFRRGADHVKIFVTGGVSSPGTMLDVERLHARGDPRRRRGGRARRAPTPPPTPTAEPGCGWPCRRAWARSSTARSPTDEDIALMIERRRVAHLHLRDLPAPDAASRAATGSGRRSWRRCAGPVGWWTRTSRATSPPASASRAGPTAMHGAMPFELETLVRLASRRTMRCWPARAGAPRRAGSTPRPGRSSPASAPT